VDDWRAKAQAYILGAHSHSLGSLWNHALIGALARINREPTLGCLNLSFEEGKALLEEILGCELEIGEVPCLPIY